MSIQFGPGAFGASTLLRGFGARSFERADNALTEIAAARSAASLYSDTAASALAAFDFGSASADTDLVIKCGCAYCMKSVGDQFSGDGSTAAGEGGATPVPAALVTTDDVPDDTSTNRELEIGGAHQFEAIDEFGDKDFYKIEVTAGEVYEVHMYARTGGENGVPLQDSYLELYDKSGKLVTNADGGKPGDEAGLDAVLAFKADYTGIYYVNARAFDNEENGPGDDGVGDYEIWAKVGDPNDPNYYEPYYSTASPLHSIDWGSQIDNTVRNPDGKQGTRDNGIPQGTPNDGAHAIAGKNVITYYLAEKGEPYFTKDPTDPSNSTNIAIVADGWEDFEADAVARAFDEYEEVADLIYVRVDTADEADFVLIDYKGTPGTPGTPSLLGRMSPPNTNDEGQAEFNSGDRRWTEEGLQPGGLIFGTLMHEFGHGHGMAHPHDNGGRSSIMRGVFEESLFNYSHGDFNLNQGIHTIMSYEDGWEDSPYGQPDSAAGYGFAGSLMAFDIAVIQDKYGVNESHNGGNNVYRMKDVNAFGTYYECIWDTGGTDRIQYDGARDANIDLRAATLKYEVGGGGWLSYAYGIHGGFLIANGVTIENATGGSGDDELTGNAGSNVLSGRGGDDLLEGRAGADRLFGGDGHDTANLLNATVGANINRLTAIHSGAAAGDYYVSIEQFLLTNHDDTFRGLNIDETVYGYFGDDALYGGGGDDFLGGGAGADMHNGGDGFDTASYRLSSSAVNINRVTGANTGSAQGDTFTSIEAFDLTHFVDRYTGGSGFDYVNGLGGNDFLLGGGGDDVLIGDGGADLIDGGSGIDTASYRLSSTAATLDLGSGVHSGAAQGDGLESVERFLLTDLGDRFTGGAGIDRVFGYAGGDNLNGAGGADQLKGGLGQDTLTGGAGRDWFIYSSLSESRSGFADRITDLSADDVIDLRGIDANGSAAGNGAFSRLAGDGAFTAAGQMRLTLHGADTWLELNTDGDAQAESIIVLTGVHNQANVEDGWML